MIEKICPIEDTVPVPTLNSPLQLTTFTTEVNRVNVELGVGRVGWSVGRTKE